MGCSIRSLHIVNTLVWGIIPQRVLQTGRSAMRALSAEIGREGICGVLLFMR